LVVARPSGRGPGELRRIAFTRRYTRHAEGSCLVEFGDTRVLCTASVEERVPPWLRGAGQGWVTAEYGMLPRATTTRSRREAASGKQSGRTQEIQRLIGRSLRAAVDLRLLGDRTITVDCDVLQADGGTRTASVTGGCVALLDALSGLRESGNLRQNPVRGLVAAVSAGIHAGVPVVDLDYAEDKDAGTDMNFVMDEHDGFIEVQGTAETTAFTLEELVAMTELARDAIRQLIRLQREALAP